MSYARFGLDGSHVYVFLTQAGSAERDKHGVESVLECCGCVLSDEWPRMASTDAMIAHLDDHRAAGDVVPDYTYAGLRRDDAENFPVT